MNMNATILGQTVAFIVFVWFCMKFVWPPIMGAIDARQKEIADGLSSAERAKKDLALAQNHATEQLKDAKLESAQIVELANKRKAQIVEDATREAQAEREKILAQAQAEVEAERSRVKEELRKQVATLALVGAEKILERQIDAAANSDIVEKVVAEL